MFTNFPFEHQLDLKDCGPACLKIIARHYGRYYSLQLIRDLCGIGREGVSMLDMSYAAENMGLKCLCLNAAFNDLKDKMPLPCIVYWNNSHFVVVYKIKGNKIFVSDPALGLQNYSQEKFVSSWYTPHEQKGSLMLLEPQADFHQVNISTDRGKKRTWNNFLNYFLPYKKSFVNLFAVMLIITILQGLLPFISKAVIDIGIQTNDLKFINIVLIANIAIIVSITLSNIVRDWIMLHITSRININLVSDYLIKLMKLPVSFFENKLTGDILQRANDLERIRSFVMNNSLNLIFSFVTFIVFTIILLSYNYIIFVIFFSGSLLYAGWILFFLKIRKKMDWEYFDLISQNQSYWVETISSIQDIKINNYEKKRRWKWEAIQARLYKVNQRVLSVSNTQNLGAQFINGLTNMLIIFFCAKAVINGHITFGVMISTQFIIGMLSGPVLQLISFIQSAQYAQISFLRINEIHDLQDEEAPSSNNAINLPDTRNLYLKNVSFQYTRHGPFILNNINIIIPEGKVTAIVGDSGSGKSTLLKLLLRLYSPSYGEISLGEMNIKNISLKQWRDLCGAVMQDGKILNDSILNNITLDDDKTDYEMLKRAVKAANISKEIENLPLAYQTIMGEMGRGLSGGQKQRILIARALYQNPDFLFFDEATNALDSINEQKIVSALDEIFKGKTVIVVAHRLSTIQKADQIVVLRNGTISEIGNHEMLMRKEGHYYNLVKSQMGGPIYA